MTDRISKMIAARQDGRSIQSIADEHGISRERVRQLIGNTGNIVYERMQKERRDFLKQFKGKDNAFISEKLRTSTNNVSRLRRQFDAKIHHPYSGDVNSAVAVGEWGEVFVSDQLDEAGIKHTLMPLGFSYDILCENGCRIDVKTTLSIGATNPYTKSPQWRFHISQKGKEKCDFFVCVIPTREFFVIPSSRASLSLSFCWPTQRPTMHKYEDCHMNLEPVHSFRHV